jgi:hypothetical protein
MKLLDPGMKLFFLAGAILTGGIMVFSGCSPSNNKGSTTLTTPFNGLMPLAVGNYWQYSKVDYDSASGLPIDTVSDAINIISEVSVNGTAYYQQNQESITNIDAPSYFLNIDSNTVDKIDSAVQYTFFKRVTTDSSLQGSWPDTVTSRCKGNNLLVGFTDSLTIDGYECLHNEVQVNDCMGSEFEKWEYYLKPGLGLVRIQLYKVNNNTGSFWLQFQEDLTAYHTD